MQPLARFEKIYNDHNALPGLRALAATILQLSKRAEQAGLPFKAAPAKRRKWDAVINVHIGGIQFRISVSADDRWGNYLVELAQGGELPDWVYVCPSGALESQQTSDTWWVLEAETCDVDGLAAEMSEVIWTCGRWHKQKLGGVMPKCEACGYESTCRVKYGLVITGGQRGTNV